MISQPRLTRESASIIASDTCVYFHVSIASSKAKPWINETGSGPGVGVCLSTLSCGPRLGTKHWGRTPKICVTQTCYGEDLLRNVRTQTIHPLLPEFQSSTSPGAHPLLFTSGDRIPQPTTAPRSMCRVVAGPMIIPWPIYAGEGFSVHNQLVARGSPKTGRPLS